MKFAVAITLLLLLVGCAHKPVSLTATCVLNAPPETTLLTIIDGEQRTQLLLSAQQQANTLALVGLNPVGARLFSGELRAGRITVQAASHYRGADPVLLLWGYSLWLSQTQAQGCWSNDTLQLRSLTTDELQLWQGKQLVASWNPAFPAEIALPQAELRLRMRAMD